MHKPRHPSFPVAFSRRALRISIFLLLLLSILSSWPAWPENAGAQPGNDWIGDFKGGRFESLDDAELELLPDHSFQLNGYCLKGGDVGIEAHASGKFSQIGDRLEFQVNEKSDTCSISEKFLVYPLKEGERYFLLEESNLEAIVNSLNHFGYENADSYMRRGPSAIRDKGEHFIKFDSKTNLPPEYQKLVLDKPIAGNIIKIGPVSKEKINFGGWMQPARPGNLYSAKVTIDIGTRQGAFLGMNLYTARGNDFNIGNVTPEQAEGTIYWADRELRPEVDQPVFSTINFMLLSSPEKGDVTLYRCITSHGTVRRSNKDGSYICHFRK